MDKVVQLGLLWAVVFISGGQSIPDPCITGNYKELNDFRRSSGYRMVHDAQGLCDNNMDPGWYRFTSSAGGMMSEKCIRRGQCGTIVPIWMNGTHPSIAEDIVSRVACAEFGSSRSSSTKCCDHHIPMAVKNCGGKFFIYYLYPPPSCPVAYCAGNKSPCPAGQWSPSGLSPCTKIYPIIHTSPTLVGPLTNAHAFRFACSVNYPEHHPDLKFEIQWTFDNGTDAGIPNQVIADPQRQAILPGTAITGHLDHLLRCRVRAWYDNRGSTPHKSPWRESSNAYFVGFRIEPGRIDVNDTMTQTKVRVTSTVPIVCDHSSTSACCISLSLDVHGPTNTVVVAHPCSYKLCTSDWDSRTHTASKDIVISARKNQIVDGSRPMHLAFEKLEPAGGGGYLNVFSNYTLPQVPVTVQQSAPLQCTWTGDPHITGFSRNHFHLFDAGDYTMYEHPKDNFLVQSRTYVCDKVSCQCGLIIREHNDIIYISNCGDMRHAPVVEVNHPLRQGTVIKRSNDGKEITVYLPSGREVKLTMDEWKGHPFQNNILTVPASDKADGKGRGICGTPDASTDNEFTYRNGTVEKDPCAGTDTCVPAAFEESWRNNNSDSLFHTIPPPVQTSAPDPHYCQCDVGVAGPPRINCSVTAAHALKCPPCLPFTPTPTFIKTPGPVHWSTTRRRDVSTVYADMDEPDPLPTNIKRSNTERWNLKWPTPSGITEAQARDQCRAVIRNAQLFTYCQTNTGMMDRQMENCMLDTLFLDGYDMIESSVSAFTEGCQFELVQDLNNYQLDTDGNLQLKRHVTDVCTTSCLRHGRCVDGACVCNTGYTGSSCQLVAGKAPRLLRIRGSDQCDVNQKPCRKIYMDAEGFEMSDNFSCKVQEVLPDGSLSHILLRENADFVTSGKLACQLPDAEVKSDRSVKTYAVSMTYDGHLYSNALNVTVYDSTCQTCNGSRCTQKADTCLINHLCYQDGDVKPYDATKMCKTSVSTSHWSDTALATEHHPNLGKPTLGGPSEDNVYSCSFPTTSHENNARFEVTWLVNKVEVPGIRMVLLAGESVVDLSSDEVPHVSGTLECQVRSFYAGDTSFSAHMISNGKDLHAND